MPIERRAAEPSRCSRPDERREVGPRLLQPADPAGSRGVETVLLAAWAAAAVLLVLLAIAEMTKHRRLEREKRRHLYGRWWERRSRDRSARTSRFDTRVERVRVAPTPTLARGAAAREQAEGATSAAAPDSDVLSSAVSVAASGEVTQDTPTRETGSEAATARRSFSDDDVASKRRDDVTPGAPSDQPLLVGFGLAASVLAGLFLVRKRR